MKIPKKLVISILMLVLVLCGSTLWLYLKFEPSRHFRSADIPVLASPSSVPEAKANEGVNPNAGLSGTDGRPEAGGLGGNEGNAQNEGAVKKAAGSFNILLLATDARAAEASRTDVLMLVHVNPKNGSVHLLSIPRDTRVRLPGIGLTKINHAHAMAEARGKSAHAGTEAAIQAVSNLCGCSINYYVKTDFAGFEHFVDTIGGIDIELASPVRLTYHHLTLPAGNQHWDGQTALRFVRERKSLPDGDNARQQNQALVLKAIAQKLLVPDNLSRLPDLANQAMKDVLDTNLTKSDMISLAWMAKNIDAADIGYTQFPGNSGKAYDPLVKTDLYYWMPDMAAWEQMSGEVLGD